MQAVPKRKEGYDCLTKRMGGLPWIPACVPQYGTRTAGTGYNAAEVKREGEGGGSRPLAPTTACKTLTIPYNNLTITSSLLRFNCITFSTPFLFKQSGIVKVSPLIPHPYYTSRTLGYYPAFIFSVFIEMPFSPSDNRPRNCFEYLPASVSSSLFEYLYSHLLNQTKE